MKYLLPALLTTSLLALLPVEVTAQPSLGGGTVVSVSAAPGIAIPDDTYNGDTSSMACTDLDFSGLPAHNINDAELAIGMTHTWVGDLTIKVVSPNGTIGSPMATPGQPGVADDGSTCCGHNADLDGTELSFWEGYANEPEDMGVSLQVVCTDDGLCTYFSNGDGASPDPNISSAFDGELSTDGDALWHVCVGDGAAGDEGIVATLTLFLQGDDVSANEGATELPEGYQVSNAYPNPFNPQTQFTVIVGETQNIVADVYNELGQKVARIYDGVMVAGQSVSLTFEANGLPSGLYLVRLAGDEFSTTRSVSLLK